MSGVSKVTRGHTAVDSALLTTASALHDDITPLEYRTWHCFETPPDLPFLTVAWVGYSISSSPASPATPVCYVVFSATRMRTVTNILIANMAAGDLLIACLCMPFTFPTLVVSASGGFRLRVGGTRFVAISADRYTAIVHPLVSRGSRLRTRIVLLVWEGNGRRYYTVVVMLLQYFLPVTVLAVTYGRIALEVWGRSSPFIRSQDVREIRLARAKRK
ncbi:RYamide receptor-like, partial [Pollicipes pollicipes]|uniref:RYamide receptor-like n=1 Tax=Pollicipes pollicipes TaxID=41117 RepID=UPI001885899A